MFYVHRGDFTTVGAVRKFFTKRVVRIAPLYWVLTSLSVGILIFAPNLTRTGQKIDICWILASYFFVPAVSPSGVVAPVLGVGWTLNYEFLFYYLFGISLLFKGFDALILITLAIIGLVFFGTLHIDNQGLISFYTSWLLCDFLGGVWVAWYVTSRGPLRSTSKQTLLIIGLSVFLVTVPYPPDETNFSRFIFWGLPSLVFVLVGYDFKISSRVGRFLIILGNSSYSIYLSQVFFLPIWAKIISWLDQRVVAFDAAVLILMLLVVLSGVLVWLLIEKPLNLAVRRIILKG